ncbi:MAG: aminoacyl-tRNA hydrolase [Sphaerochaeta sp.]|jgi:PTH1 family peptidyl-tRNA hydrolase|uniref:aminoacyl-tRNA hydrolase n=1 Tax=Sphaerochaeta sp. TaxID=1972642 RepID=UPI003D099B0C
MKLILGLGNPGTKYADSRHNVGFSVLDASAAFFQVRLRKRCFHLYRYALVVTDNEEFLLVQPLTYMNASGKVLKYFPQVAPEDIIVVCDQMDLPSGMIRIRKGGSSAGHNGLKSLMQELDSGEFVRIYIGIGRPSEGVDVVDHVLGKETGPDLQQGIRLGAEALNALIKGDSVQEVMIAYNRRNRSS